jgi:hypothetical protein
VDPLESRVAALEARLAQMVPTLTLDTDAEGRAQVKLIDGTRTTIVTVPGLLDRGPWRSGTRYVRGDVVSHQRSLFICQRDNPAGKPEDSSGDWRLAVMRGRDGRDATKDGAS